jgi:hypothetical protein
MPKIKVPKPPAKAFNQHRRVSDLLRWQMKHMATAETALPFENRTAINVYQIKTEEEAAAYLQKVTGALARKVHLSTRVTVPKPPKTALNKNRRISQLLMNQVQHFREVEKKWPQEQQTHIDPQTLKSEGDAAAYISAVTSKLLALGSKKR